MNFNCLRKFGNDVIAISSPGVTLDNACLQILKSALDFIIALRCMYTSILHRFWYNEHFLFAGNDVIAIPSPEGASVLCEGGFREGIFHIATYDYTSIVHYFRNNELLLFFWNDVIAISSLRVTSGIFSMLFCKFCIDIFNLSSIDHKPARSRMALLYRPFAFYWKNAIFHLSPWKNQWIFCNQIWQAWLRW